MLPFLNVIVSATVWPTIRPTAHGPSPPPEELSCAHQPGISLPPAPPELTKKRVAPPPLNFTNFIDFTNFTKIIPAGRHRLRQPNAPHATHAAGKLSSTPPLFHQPVYNR
jgi:hypothetical protein